MGILSLLTASALCWQGLKESRTKHEAIIDDAHASSYFRVRFIRVRECL